MRDELESLWQASQEHVKGEEMLDMVRKKSEDFERTIRRRNRVEVGGCLFVLVFFSFLAWKAPDAWVRVGSGLVALSGAWIAWYIRKFGSPGKPADPAQSLAGYREQLTRQYDRQIRLLKTVKYWYLLPPYAGLMVMTYGLLRKKEHWMVQDFAGAIVYTAVFAVVWWLNEVYGIRKLQRMKQALGVLAICLLLAVSAPGQDAGRLQKMADGLMAQINAMDVKAIRAVMNDSFQQAVPACGAGRTPGTSPQPRVPLESVS